MGFEIANQHTGYAQGLRIEAGCFTSPSSVCAHIPTQLKTLVAGFVWGDISDPGSGAGNIVSICEGPLLNCKISDSTCGDLHYIAVGF